MGSGKVKFISVFILHIFLFTAAFAQTETEKHNAESLEKGLELLRKYIVDENNWHLSNPELRKNVQGLIHFIFVDIRFFMMYGIYHDFKIIISQFFFFLNYYYNLRFINAIFMETLITIIFLCI